MKIKEYLIKVTYIKETEFVVKATNVNNAILKAKKFIEIYPLNCENTLYINRKRRYKAIKLS